MNPESGRFAKPEPRGTARRGGASPQASTVRFREVPTGAGGLRSQPGRSDFANSLQGGSPGALRETEVAEPPLARGMTGRTGALDFAKPHRDGGPAVPVWRVSFAKPSAGAVRQRAAAEPPATGAGETRVSSQPAPGVACLRPALARLRVGRSCCRGTGPGAWRARSGERDGGPGRVPCPRGTGTGGSLCGEAERRAPPAAWARQGRRGGHDVTRAWPGTATGAALPGGGPRAGQLRVTRAPPLSMDSLAASVTWRSLTASV